MVFLNDSAAVQNTILVVLSQHCPTVHTDKQTHALQLGKIFPYRLTRNLQQFT
ncbi:hypothetical protein D3C73_1515220 [compost metagenome]